MTAAERLRALAQAATPGPWHRHTFGHRSIRSAAGQVTRALFHGVTTDLSYVHTDGEVPIALTGNGPHQTEHADLIATAADPRFVAAVADLLDAVEVEGHEAETVTLLHPGAGFEEHCYRCHAVWPCPTAKARDTIEALVDRG